MICENRLKVVEKLMYGRLRIAIEHERKNDKIESAVRFRIIGRKRNLLKLPIV